MGRERTIGKDNKKRMKNGDDQNDQGPRAEGLKHNLVNVCRPLDERADL